MAASKGYSVPAIDRALTVLEFLGRSKRGYSISEMSQKLRIPKSSTHLILATFERRGFLQKNRHNHRYSFGLRLLGLSRSALANLDLREEARPFLQTLMQKTGLTVHMAVLERDEAVIVEKVEAPGLVRLASWIGRRLDVNCTGVGKALISFLPSEDLDYLLRTKTFSRHNSHTIISKNALRRELTLIQQCGYALDNEEDEPGVRCIGVPVFDENHAAVAAISVVGTTSQIAMDRVPKLAAIVKQSAKRLSKQLGDLTLDK